MIGDVSNSGAVTIIAVAGFGGTDNRAFFGALKNLFFVLTINDILVRLLGSPAFHRRDILNMAFIEL
jgi:hypothetical protein